MKECDGGIIINLLYWAHPQEEAQCGQKPERQRAEEGLAQGQDGRYSARFAARADKRTERYSHTLPEACSRQEDARYKGCAFAPFEMAADAASGWVLLELEEGKHVPAASKISDVSVPTGSMVNMVILDMDAYAEKYGSKAVRKNITIPAWLNTYGEKNNINFSHLLSEALLKQVQEA